MSSLTNTVSKGERSKAKFPSININNIYLESRGESNETQKQQKTANRKPGFQILGKVSTARRPANLPSVKSEKNSSENINNNNTTNNVTTTQGWNKPETTISVTTSTPSQTSTQSNSIMTITINTSNVQLHANTDKSWSSITSSGVEATQPPPKFYGPQFQQEFPSLSSSDISPNQQKSNTEFSFLQGPSLRPQTEGFWASGGGQTKSTVSSSENKLINNNTSQLMSIQSCSTIQSTQLSPQMRNIIPSFVPKSNYPVNISTNVTKSTISSYTTSNVINRKYVPNSSFQLMENKTTTNVEPVGFRAKPIINQDELGKMDIKTRNAGWATRDDIDYNQKLTFSDDEDNQIRNKKNEEIVKEKKRVTSEFISKLQHPQLQQQQQQCQPHTDNLEDDDIWNQRRLQQSKEIALAAERARKRKEEEEKRFLENKSKDHTQHSNQIKTENEISKENQSDIKCGLSNSVEPIISSQNSQNVERKSTDKEGQSTVDAKISSSFNIDTSNQKTEMITNIKTKEDKRDSSLIEPLRNEIYESKTSMEDYAIFDCSDYDADISSTNIGTEQWGKIDKSNKPWDSSPIVQKERKRQFTTRSSIGNRDEKRQVPGPITRDKIEADDLKNEKRELVSLKPALHVFDKKSDQSSTMSTKTTTVTSSIINSTMTSNMSSKIISSLKETVVKNNDHNTKQTEKLSSTKTEASTASNSTTITTTSVTNTKETLANNRTTAIATVTTNATITTTTTTTAIKSSTITTTNVTPTTTTATNTTKSKRILEDGWTFASENKPNRNMNSNRDVENNKINNVSRNVSDKKTKDDISKKSDRSHNDRRTNNSNNNDNRYWDYGAIYESNYNSRGRRVASDTRKKTSMYSKSTDYSNYDYGYDYDYNYEYDYDYDDLRRYRSSATKSSTTKRLNKDKGNDVKSSKSSTNNHDDSSKLSSSSMSGKGKSKEIDYIENTKKNETNSKPENEIKETKKVSEESSWKRSTHPKTQSQNRNQSNNTNESKKSLVRKSKSDLGDNDEMVENVDQKSMYSDDDYTAKRSSKGYSDFHTASHVSYRTNTRNHDRRITSSSNNTQWNKPTKVSNYKSSYPKHGENNKKSADYKDKSASYKNETIDSAKYENSEQKVHHGTNRAYGKTFNSHKTYDESTTRESRFERQKSFGNSNNVHKYSKKYSENNQENRNNVSKDVSNMSSSKSSSNTVASSSNHNNATNVPVTTSHNAWNKPITGHLKSDTNFNSVSKSDQTSEKNIVLDGSSAPVNTIIFENKNFKSVPKQATNNFDQGKLKYRNQSKSNEKNTINNVTNTNYKKDDEHLPNALLFSKPLNDIINESLQKHELADKNVPSSSTTSQCTNSLQLSMSFNKNEDNSDMKLDFGFESELNPSNEEKNKNMANTTTISTGQSELNKKIQSVKKVWETNVLDQPLHNDDDNYKSVYESNGAFTASSNASLEASESPSVVAATVVAGVGGTVNIPNSNTAPNICKVKPTTQTTQINNQSHVSFNIPSNSNVVIPPNLLEQKHSPPPQLLQILNSGSFNLNQVPQQFSANQHLSAYQPNVNNGVQFSAMSTISSPPTALVLNSTQNSLYGPLQIDQSQNRSQYAQFAAALPSHPSSFGIGQNATSPLCGSMPSLYLTTPPPSVQTQDLYQNLASQYRMTQNAAFGQPQQINNPATVLISSTSNSLMSASVKQSSQQLSAIGTKGNQSFHQSSQHAQSQAQPPPPQPQPHQAQLYMAATYDSAGIPSNFLSNANVLQRNTLGPAVQSNILASSLQGHSSNFYSNTNATQNAHFQQTANSAIPAGSSFGIHSNLFGPSQNFGSQFLPSIPINSNNSMAQPFRTNTIQAQNASYLKSYSGDLRSNLNQDPMSSYNSATVQQNQSRNKSKPINSPVSPSNKNYQNINTK